LPPLSAAEDLKQAYARARAAGDVDRRVRELAGDCERLEARARARLAALGLWQGPLEAAAALALPTLETLLRFEGEFEAQRIRLRDLEKRHSNLLDRQTQIEQSIAGIERSGAVPSELDLEKARARRDLGWARVRVAWRTREPIELVVSEIALEIPLASAFEAATTSADEVADRLRREAQRVSELAALSAERDALRAQATRLESERNELCAALLTHEQAWQAAWQAAAIRPLSPAEMRGWLARHGQLTESVERLGEARAALRFARAEQSSLAAELARVLERAESDAEAAVTPLLLACEAELERVAERQRKRGALGERVLELSRRKDAAQRELSELARERADWSAEWGLGVRRLGFEGELSAEDAGAVVEAISELFAKLKELSSLRLRVEAMESEALEFQSFVAGLLGEHAPDLQNRAADAAAEELVRRFQAAAHDRGEQSRLSAELSDLERERQELEAKADLGRGELTALMRAVGASDLNQLAYSEERAQNARELETQLDAVESELIEAGGGLSLEQLLVAAEGADRGALRARLVEIKDDLDRLDEVHQNLSADARSLEQGLLLYEDTEAADRAQTLAVCAAEIREQALRYARLRLAAVVLDREVERYREQNQGPVMKRASELFPRLTLGHYRGLRAGVDERMLVAVRQDGKEVRVPELSEGARYQLYLALRIASLERYLDNNPALPLVLDDVLIHFDDERAAAAFSVLGDLAERVQILFFTHHARDLTVSRNAVTSSRLFTHELPARAVK
jgi:uncharacterized protein YhaN